MTKKLSPLWVRSVHGERLHRKREYGAKSKTLCGLHTGPGWMTAELWAHRSAGHKERKCKRCAA